MNEPPIHIIVKLLETKHNEKILKAARTFKTEKDKKLQQTFCQKWCKPEGNETTLLKVLKRKKVNLNCIFSKNIF